MNGVEEKIMIRVRKVGRLRTANKQSAVHHV
jgi:hypothetical protein